MIDKVLHRNIYRSITESTGCKDPIYAPTTSSISRKAYFSILTKYNCFRKQHVLIANRFNYPVTRYRTVTLNLSMIFRVVSNINLAVCLFAFASESKSGFYSLTLVLFDVFTDFSVTIIYFHVPYSDGIELDSRERERNSLNSVNRCNFDILSFSCLFR